MTFTKIKDSVGHFYKNTLPEFFENNFEISTTKRLKIIAAVLTTILLAIVVIDVRAFTSLTFKSKWILLAIAMTLPFIIGIVTAFNIKIKNHFIDKIWHSIFFLLMPIVTITMTECLNNLFIYNMTYLGFFANYVVITLFNFLIFAVSGSMKLPILIVNPILYALALAHNFIMEFRGTPFLPMDFLSISTAKGVANTYNYKLTYTILIATLIFIFIIIIGIKHKTPKYNFITKIVSRTFAGTFFAVIMILFFGTNVFANAGVKPDFWNQSRGYHNYGFVFNFFCNTRYMYMSEPNGYNPNDVQSFVESVVDTSEDSSGENPATTPDYERPNIICIMNESLADLNVLGNFTTNEDYMPFMRSLTENTIKGNLYVPVIGAGTSNTEFEFITGHSTAFLPSGSNAYMLYVKNPLASLVSTLEDQGYSSFALHPYYASGWNRINVYNNLGFNAFKSLENILDMSIMNEYIENGSDANYLQSLVEQRYPGSNMLLRQYISDSYDYNLIIDDYQKRDKSTPYFAFNVTMQNHGGYTTSCSNFDESIHVTSSPNFYNKTNKYLSLVKASDTAFEGLINYFKTVDEPTVICMFGDHQPSIETRFIAEAMGVASLSGISLEQEQNRHVTPFFIWANYDIEEQTIDKLSANYLSSLVLETAGVKLTEYNKYLLKLSKSLPVIDTVGYIDAENNYYKWSDNSPYSSLLDEYEKIQYNSIFDQTNKNTSIFYLENSISSKRTSSDVEKEIEEREKARQQQIAGQQPAAQ